MKWSDTLISTLWQDPQEAEIPSHKLMLRAGLIRKLAGGLYTFLPLGLRALRKVEAIVREEMDRAGALEILMPALQPRELWETSHRYDIMGDVMFRLKDRQKRDMVLGPTHEEVVTSLAAAELISYRQLPKTFYQIQTKFRDEIRPRFGLMRAKEFIMKDAYSFDLSWEAADISYQKMYDAYTRIFDRCGLRTKIVEADTGAMGGKWSHEFMVLADSGEDGLAECESCSYAANLERAERALNGSHTTVFADSEKTVQETSTPEMKTIEQVSGFFKCEPQRLIKTLIYIADDKPVAAIAPGDRDINEKKLQRVLEASNLVLADAATIQRVTGAPVGFAGPVGLNIPVYADFGLKGYAGAIAGGNKADTHIVNVNLDRDAKVVAYHDLCIIKQGDSCPKCGKALREKRGVEVGHVFKLGTKYSNSFNAQYLDAEGNKQIMIMGCYGIGVTRTLQSVVEQSHDANGIVWPLSIAPYRVVVTVLNTKHAESLAAAEQMVSDLQQNGIDTILDDRDERAGIKLKDADLIGFPVRVIVSERSLGKNSVEVKARTAAKADLVQLTGALEHILSLCRVEPSSSRQ